MNNKPHREYTVLPSATEEHGFQKVYESLLLTYIRELNKAHKGIRRLVRRNRKLEAENERLNRILKPSSDYVEFHEFASRGNTFVCDVCGLGPYHAVHNKGVQL